LALTKVPAEIGIAVALASTRAVRTLLILLIGIFLL